MAVGTVTVTAKDGAGVQATALPVTNCSIVTFDLGAGMLRLVASAGYKEFDFGAATTITFTVTGSGGNATIAVS